MLIRALWGVISSGRGQSKWEQLGKVDAFSWEKYGDRDLGGILRLVPWPHSSLSSSLPLLLPSPLRLESSFTVFCQPESGLESFVMDCLCKLQKHQADLKTHQ